MIGVCSENAREHADAEEKVAASKNKQAYKCAALTSLHRQTALLELIWN